MKSIFLFGVLSFSVFGMKAFSQSTTITTKESTTNNQVVNQPNMQVVDENPGADAPVDGYVFNEKGELVQSKVHTSARKITIKKSDYDALPVEKQIFIKEDQASFTIIE
jgi:hypothetical protein